MLGARPHAQGIRGRRARREARARAQTCKVDFPADYGSPNLAGKTARVHGHREEGRGAVAAGARRRVLPGLRRQRGRHRGAAQGSAREHGARARPGDPQHACASRSWTAAPRPTRSSCRSSMVERADPASCRSTWLRRMGIKRRAPAAAARAVRGDRRVAASRSASLGELIRAEGIEVDRRAGQRPARRRTWRLPESGRNARQYLQSRERDASDRVWRRWRTR